MTMISLYTHTMDALHLACLFLCWCLHVNAANPPGVDAWLWQRDAQLDDMSFGYYKQHSGSFEDIPTCVLECLQTSECVSFTVEVEQGGWFQCQFHTRRFSVAESSYLGSQQTGLQYYAIHSECPVSDSHFFSREAWMCLEINVLKRTMQEAENYCQANGGSLVIIDSDIKEAYVTNVMEQYSSWTAQPFHTAGSVIIGVYSWYLGFPVSWQMMTSTSYVIGLDCVEVVYNGTSSLLASPYDCAVKRMGTICEYPIES